MKVVAYIDGSSKGNPGKAGYGIVIKDEDDRTIYSAGEYIGEATNNVAEYRGLMGCLELVRSFGISSLVVYSDSKLLVNQMNGSYRITKPHLKALHEKIKKTLDSMMIDFEINYIPREENSMADSLAKRSVRLQKRIEEEE